MGNMIGMRGVTQIGAELRWVPKRAWAGKDRCRNMVSCFEDARTGVVSGRARIQLDGCGEGLTRAARGMTKRP
jgi:hypothetical protein